MKLMARSVEALVRLPATEVKRRGWRGVMRALADEQQLVVTNHDEPQAVVLSIPEYKRIMQALERAESTAESELEALRRRFDERLAALQAPDAGDRLGAALRSPLRLDGELKAGSGY